MEGADQAIGQPHGELALKIHVIVNATGKVKVLSLMPGQRTDITEVDPLLKAESIPPDRS